MAPLTELLSFVAVPALADARGAGTAAFFFAAPAVRTGTADDFALALAAGSLTLLPLKILAAGLLAPNFFAAGFLAIGFLVGAGFLATGFLAGAGFLATDFLTGVGFLATGFLAAADFLATGFLAAADFLTLDALAAVGFLVAGFFAAGFLAIVFLSALMVGRVLLAAPFGAGLVAERGAFDEGFFAGFVALFALRAAICRVSIASGSVRRIVKGL